MGRMDEEETVFEQLTLSDLKKWSSAALGGIQLLRSGGGGPLKYESMGTGWGVAHQSERSHIIFINWVPSP